MQARSFYGAALLLSCVTGLCHAQVGDREETAGGRAARDHPAVVTAQLALTNGAAFSTNFYLLPTSDDPEQVAALRENLQKQLDGLRERFPANVVFSLIDGLEVTRVRAELPAYFRMKGEDAFNISRFRFPPEQQHQVYMAFSALDKEGLEICIHLLMYPVGGAWRARFMTYGPIAIGEMSAQKALQAGIKEQRAGDDLLALALYELSGQLAKGPDYRVSGDQQLVKFFGTRLVRKLQLPEKPVEVLNAPEGRIEIRGAGALIIPNGPAIILQTSVPALGSEEAMTAQHSVIVKACLDKHPRLPSYFKAIAVATVAEDKQVFQKIYALRPAEPEEGAGRPQPQPAGPPAP